jgi:hypothetical protein
LFTRITDVDSKFHSSCVSNVIESLSEAKSLNISDDSGLDKLFDEISNKMSGFDADTIRANMGVRTNAAKATQDALNDITSAMEAFMN